MADQKAQPNLFGEANTVYDAIESELQEIVKEIGKKHKSIGRLEDQIFELEERKAKLKNASRMVEPYLELPAKGEIPKDQLDDDGEPITLEDGTPLKVEPFFSEKELEEEAAKMKLEAGDQVGLGGQLETASVEIDEEEKAEEEFTVDLREPNGMTVPEIVEVSNLVTWGDVLHTIEEVKGPYYRARISLTEEGEAIEIETPAYYNLKLAREDAPRKKDGELRKDTTLLSLHYMIGIDGVICNLFAYDSTQLLPIDDVQAGENEDEDLF